MTIQRPAGNNANMYGFYPRRISGSSSLDSLHADCRRCCSKPHLVPAESAVPIAALAMAQHGGLVFTCACEEVSIRSNCAVMVRSRSCMHHACIVRLYWWTQIDKHLALEFAPIVQLNNWPGMTMANDRCFARRHLLRSQDKMGEDGLKNDLEARRYGKHL